MSRKATTEQVAAALHVRPATVRKYARERRIPFDTTPGGHRRFDVDEAVDALLGAGPNPGHDEGLELATPVPFVRVPVASEVNATTIVTAVGPAEVGVYDTTRDVEDWAAETTVA